MPPTNPRKRPAPGSIPAFQASQMPQSYTAASQVSNPELLRWNQQPDNAAFADPSFNMNNYNTNGLSQVPFDQAAQASSTQIARRPINRQLVPTGQRTFDASDASWAQFGDESMLDTSNNNGALEENDNIELLEERAQMAKRDSQSKRKQIPPFVQKLSSFLEKSVNTDLIRWSDRGDSFVVLDEDEFARTLIPELFKHNNYASFVRQLNMYGFHKRVGLSDNSMKASERKNKSPSEYYNPYFKRGHPNLLWLINKPKGGNTKGRKSRVKNEDGDAESDEEGKDVEEVYGNNVQASRALSAAPESGSLQRRDVAVLQNQLAEVQKQQGAITNAIARLRKDHNQLYQQSMAFQNLHDRHENSINAILTFLATVYNRSLDGQGPQNIAQMFNAGIPHTEQQHQGNVVDIGDVTNQAQQATGSMSPSPHRRAQRLLMAPPTGGGRATTASPANSKSTPQPQGISPSPQPVIEELFDTSPADTTQSPTDSVRPPPHMMMNIINNTNSQNRTNNGAMEFPEMLSHYENSNGNSPLTSEQRNTMLNMIANTSSAAGSNNALVNPMPPQPPTLEELGYTAAEIEELSRLQAEQEARIQDIKNVVVPLSPSGQIPGLDTDDYFNGTETSDPTASNLDLDQYLDNSAFFTGSSPVTHGDYNFDTFGDPGVGDSHFDLGMDGTNDNARVETTNNSNAATPENATMQSPAASNGMQSPAKRRKKN